MNPLEQQLDYVFKEAIPDPGTVSEVAPGVFWARMPLPFVLDHINVWLLRDQQEDKRGWTVIDCGITNDTIKSHWERIFEEALDGAAVQRVIVTHCHPDHIGLADWICRGAGQERWKKLRLWMSLGEYSTAQVLTSGKIASNAGGTDAARHLRRHGVTEETTLEQVAHRAEYYPRLVPSVPSQFRRLMGGDKVEIGGKDWRVILGYGHSPEHCAFYSEALNVLISGDMVLPRISTNVSVFDMEPEGDPLRLFLESFDAYEPLPRDTLVLPSHGKPFRGLHTRLQQLRDHHAARLDEVRHACAVAPQSAADIVPLMFHRKLDAHQMTFALGEALAHLNCLWHRKELQRITDDGGVIRFIPA